MKSYEIYSSNKNDDQPIMSARMCLPPLELSSLVFAMIERDTRHMQLDDRQRFNYFPVSALCSIVLVLDGQSHLIVDPEIPPQDNPILPPLSFVGPFNKPFASWSPGALHSVCISFYPESWADLTGRQVGEFLNRAVPLETVIGGPLLTEFENLSDCASGAEALEALGKSVAGCWRNQRTGNAHMLSDWIRRLTVRAAMSGAGQSLRQVQRRIKAWTGGSRRTLDKTVRMETLHKEIMIRQESGDLSLASLAHDLGYADQSHMGREFRDMTGMSPQKIGQLTQSDENYWCYRLLGERFL